MATLYDVMKSMRGKTATNQRPTQDVVEELVEIIGSDFSTPTVEEKLVKYARLIQTLMLVYPGMGFERWLPCLGDCPDCTNYEHVVMTFENYCSQVTSEPTDIFIVVF